jgi:hypothetical protein
MRDALRPCSVYLQPVGYHHERGDDELGDATMRRASGVSSLAAIVVEQAIKDYLFAPHDSAAYRTARKFLVGGECSHIICSTCLDNKPGWRNGECPPGVALHPCACGHGWDVHLIMQFDWTEYRDIMSGAAGIETQALEALCTPAPTAEEPFPLIPILPTSKPASRKS